MYYLALPISALTDAHLVLLSVVLGVLGGIADPCLRWLRSERSVAQ